MPSATLPHLRAGTAHKEAHWCAVYQQLGEANRRTAEAWIADLFAVDFELLAPLYTPRLNAYCDGRAPMHTEVANVPCDEAEPLRTVTIRE